MRLSSDSRVYIRSRFLPAKMTRSETPTVYAMAGIPGAGKSHFVSRALQTGRFPESSFLLDPDGVMTALPEYRQLIDSNDSARAFSDLELPARELAYDMLNEAVSRSLDIIKDMGCVREENFLMLADLKQRGYRIEMHYIRVGTETALQRIKLRETETGRHTPEGMIVERQSALKSLLPRYRILADRFCCYDNDDLDDPFRPAAD